MGKKSLSSLLFSSSTIFLIFIVLIKLITKLKKLKASSLISSEINKKIELINIITKNILESLFSFFISKFNISKIKQGISSSMKLVLLILLFFIIKGLEYIIILFLFSFELIVVFL